ncbi:hypothetical protein ACX9P6_004735, partial [Citrobacter braakii]
SEGSEGAGLFTQIAGLLDSILSQYEILTGAFQEQSKTSAAELTICTEEGCENMPGKNRHDNGSGKQEVINTRK